MLNNSKILLVEDDPNLGSILKESLSLKGAKVALFPDGEAAWNNFNKADYDMCLLDIMMPKKDGFTLARDIRTVAPEIPIIFLTAKNMKNDKVEGFNIGADDYITKPFSMDELILRIEAILRRTKKNTTLSTSDFEFHIGQYTLDTSQRLLRFGKQAPIKLTTKECDLLKMLCMNINNVLQRELALKAIWGNDNYFTGRSMDVYVTKLRKYLREDPLIEILNIHGVGFKLVVKA